MSLFGGGGNPKTQPAVGRPSIRDQIAMVTGLGQVSMPMQPFTTYAPFNPLQIGGQQGALDYAQSRFDPGVAFQQGTLQSMMSAPQNVMSNPTLGAMMGANQAQITDTLQRDWLPQIGSAAVRGGGYGGSRQGIAEGVAMGDAAQALANANAQMMYGAYSDALGQQRAGAQLMPQALQLGFMGPQTAMDIGAMQQAQDQQRINEMSQRYYYPEQKAREQMTWAIPALQSLTSQFMEQKGGQPSALAQGLGLGMTGLGMLGGLGGLSGLFGGGASAMAPISAVSNLPSTPVMGNFGFGTSSPYSASAGGAFNYSPVSLFS